MARSRLLLALALLPLIGSPAYASPPPVWVEITRPMLSCWTLGDDYEETRAKMLKLLRHWRRGQRLAGDCSEFRVGDTLMLARKQRRGSMDFVDHCVPCSPFQWETYGPDPRVVGRYFKRIPAPKDLEWLRPD